MKNTFINFIITTVMITRRLMAMLRTFRELPQTDIMYPECSLQTMLGHTIILGTVVFRRKLEYASLMGPFLEQIFIRIFLGPLQARIFSG